MFTLLITVHTVLSVFLVIIVLLQQGKGADMGASLGGGSNTLFGAGGAADFITKLTTATAIAFMITSILLVKSYNSTKLDFSNPSSLTEDSLFANEADAPLPQDNAPANSKKKEKITNEKLAEQKKE
jgi:preprotein translocase subunit SecG